MSLNRPRSSDWSEEHIAEHSVTMDEVAQVLAAPHVESLGRNDTILVTGQTRAGRYLLVVAVDEGDGQAFVVTAREMSDREKKAYRRRARP